MIERNETTIVLSIKPEFAQLIFSLQKTIEFRRRFSTKNVEPIKAYIYSTSPQQVILGCVTISGISHLNLNELWSTCGKYSGIEKTYFDKYFQGSSMGFALHLSNPITFENLVSLVELRELFDFTPPQSYFYASSKLDEYLSSNCLP